MKKTLIRSAVALNLLLMLVTGIDSQAHSNEKRQSEIKTAGYIKNQPVYELQLNNTSYGRYTIVIADEHGVHMYEEILAGANITRKFMLNSYELGNTGVVIEVFNGSEKEATYTIKNNRVITENTLVTAKK
jgi:hypothetical protein